MVSLSAFLFGFSSAAAVLATALDLILPRSGTPSSTGTSGGYYYSFYTDGGLMLYTPTEAVAYTPLIGMVVATSSLEKDGIQEVLSKMSL
jgi:endo-1,4-beta-xylanase